MASPPVPSNVEYAELQQSNIVVPVPVVIPNFAESQFEGAAPEVSEQMPGVSPMQMADIILQYKKETQSPDYQQWVIAITAYKKIMIAKTIRDLTTEEKRIMSVVEEQIKTEMQNISLTAPGAQPPDPQQEIDDLVEQLRIAQLPAPQRWTQAEIDAVYGPPVDQRSISAQLQRFGVIASAYASSVASAAANAAPASLSASVATIGISEIARTVASLSPPDLATIGSMLGVGASATAQTIVGAIANSTGEGRLAVIGATFAAGGLLNYYMTRDASQPVLVANPAVGAQIPVSSRDVDDVTAQLRAAQQRAMALSQPDAEDLISDLRAAQQRAMDLSQPDVVQPVLSSSIPIAQPVLSSSIPIAQQPSVSISNNPVVGDPINRSDTYASYANWLVAQSDRTDANYIPVKGLRRMAIDFGIIPQNTSKKIKREPLLNEINDWVNSGGKVQDDFLQTIYESMK